MKKLTDLKTPAERREYVSEVTGVTLENIEKVLIDDEKNIHGENILGAVSIPVGVAGPLSIRSQSLSGDFYIPLATTEGALIASVNRGCRAIAESGGVSVFLEEVGVTRGPVFETGSLENGYMVKKWLEDNFDQINAEAQKTSSHLSLKKIDLRVVGHRLYARFYFDTQNAMGMNMATIATAKIVALIEKKSSAKCIAIAGNFDIDKKPASLNSLYGRGKSVQAEVVVKKSVLLSVLKTTPERLHDVWLSKCLIGSALAGSLGFNAHFANIVAAFYAATGQDLAHVVEGSLGMTTTKLLSNGDIYCSVFLPALMIGIVGGGTKLKTQQEARRIIGIKTSAELAIVLAGAVLAGEISLLASLAEGSLSQTHAFLGR